MLPKREFSEGSQFPLASTTKVSYTGLSDRFFLIKKSGKNVNGDIG